MMNEINKKVTLVDKEGNAADVTLGNMYDINKNCMEKEPTLSNSKLREKIKKMRKSLEGNHGYMLLCRELTDYTVFLYNNDNVEFETAMFECITNRGNCKGIDKLEDGAWEIWIQHDSDKEMHVYYFFNYDTGIIMC